MAAAKKTAAKSRPTSQPMPYGAPVSDAIKRGDRTGMKRLLTAAKAQVATLEKAISKLEAELKK